MKMQMRNSIGKFIFILKRQEKVFSTKDKTVLWEKVVESAHLEKERSFERKTIRIMITAAAAILLFLLHISIDFTPAEPLPLTDDVILASLHTPETDHILLITAHNDTLVVDERDYIYYSRSGEGRINRHPIQNRPGSENSFNQLIVPRGKRSQLFLSDGTKLLVNAGSWVIYPSRFLQQKREIFLDGEVYLEVNARPEQPFFVKTIADFEVEVTGTRFNISTYKELEDVSVVLAEGCVKIYDSFDHTLTLFPNEMAQITAEGVGKAIPVNAEEHIGWINRHLTLNAQDLEALLDRIEIYYGVKIEKDPSLKETPPLSGKFYLHRNFNDLLQGLSLFISVEYQETGPKQYSIKLKQ